MTQHYFTGWDIGGAHLKVAQTSAEGELNSVLQLTCPLWLGLSKLAESIESALDELQQPNQHHAITMTGELVDLFPNRQAGVHAIVDCVLQHLPEQHCHFYVGQDQWLDAKQAKQQWQKIASQNWQASVNYAASQIENGLFIDIGSTTSDIIAIRDHQAKPTAFSDFDRQVSNELHYAGAIRTPLIAIAHSVPFEQQTIRLAAELFATTADCWLLTGELTPTQIQDLPADNQSWQAKDCMQRLARLLGTDAHHYPDSVWQSLATWFNEQQINQLTQSCQTVLSKQPQLPDNAPIIGAGVGRFIAYACAQKLDRPYIDFATFFTPANPEAANHAPAAAIALLARQQLS